MAYTPNKPKLAPDSSILRSTIKGWGVDLDPAVRPAVPKERFNYPEGTGAHWFSPEQQIPTYEREMTTEHRALPPVFGTACPPKGLSGIIRRAAYKNWSEGQTAHWLTLMFADRVDVLESMVVALFRGKPDNFVAEWGVLTEFKRHGFRSRFGRHRADTKRLPIDLLTFGATIFVAAATGYAAFSALKKAVAPPKRRWLFG